MVRHSWRGAFWSRLTGVDALRREAPHARHPHCPTAPAVASTRFEPTLEVLTGYLTSTTVADPGLDFLEHSGRVGMARRVVAAGAPTHEVIA